MDILKIIEALGTIKDFEGKAITVVEFDLNFKSIILSKIPAQLEDVILSFQKIGIKIISAKYTTFGFQLILK